MFRLVQKIFVVLLIAASFINAQISPGDLTTAHQDLEGLSHCTKCHELGEQVLSSKCLACHGEIKTLVTLGKGFHSSDGVKSEECANCHPEHFGRTFRIVNFDPDDFSHNKTGYELTGAHKKIKCNQCHQKKNIADIEIAKRENTYLGLNSNCFNCHTDYHQKTLGDDCSSCHNTEKFRPSINFNHDKAKFRLTGKHKNTDCKKCHPIGKLNGEDYQKFTELKFRNCIPCHKDNHKGKFGVDCKGCHVTTGFKIINRSHFDHDKTNYPLRGKHISLSCDKCHKTGLNEKPRYEQCINCHSDYHKSQFVNKDTVRDCSECHTINGFRPSLVTIKRHNDFKFALDGAHLAFPCESCHLKTKEWKFVRLGTKCIDCHKNVHGVEIVEKYLKNNDCRQCHKTESWSTINFSHNATEFELKGKHSEQSCRACHTDSILNSKYELIFKSQKGNCEACHSDIHAGQFAEGEVSDCLRCHDFNSWKPEKFDHEKTKFSLKGAHKNLKCFSCHPIMENKGVKFIKYKLEDFKCAACHS